MNGQPITAGEKLEAGDAIYIKDGVAYKVAAPKLTVEESEFARNLSKWIKADLPTEGTRFEIELCIANFLLAEKEDD